MFNKSDFTLTFLDLLRTIMNQGIFVEDKTTHKSIDEIKYFVSKFHSLNKYNIYFAL